MAPERLEGSSKLRPSADIYSLGITMWEVGPSAKMKGQMLNYRTVLHPRNALFLHPPFFNARRCCHSQQATRASR
jgi:serine/threonine protein kinase